MKEKCFNHPSRNALSFCHSCGEYYCENCLDEGVEYYYCNKENCQIEYQKELATLNIICPNCGIDLELSKSEKRNALFRCLGCRRKVSIFGLLDEDEDSRDLTFKEIEKHLLSLNSKEKPAIAYYVSNNSFLEAIFRERNAYSLRYHFNYRDSYFQSIRDDIILAEATKAILSFKNLRGTWREDFEWEEMPVPRRFRWHKRFTNLKRILILVVGIVLGILLMMLLIGIIGGIGSILQR